MRDAGAWLARGRPMSGTIEVFAQHCSRCGRGLYIVVKQSEWGRDFCKGCDEVASECYCPETRAVA